MYAESISEHTVKLREVFNQLLFHNLKINPKKCLFMRKEVTYLGHQLSEAGCQPNSDRVIDIKNYEVNGLKDVKKVKQFLGIVGFFRRFIENMSTIAYPLTRLLKKGTPFIWSEECQRSFDLLKDKLASRPLLKFPDFSKQYIISTDASGFAVAAILQQEYSGMLHPIAYYSRCLNVHEIKYSVIEKEALAILNAFEHFRPYIYGNRFSVIVKTDHKPLKWLFNVKTPSSRLLRWRLRLEDFNYEIHYIPGNENIFADALSRDSRHNEQQNTSEEIPEINVLQNFEDQDENEFELSSLEDSDPDLDVDESIDQYSEQIPMLSFDTFMELSHHSEIENPNYKETNADIDKSSDPLILFLPADLKISFPDHTFIDLEEIKSRLPDVLRVGDVHIFDFRRRKAYVIITKTHYFENELLENLYYFILTLKGCLVRDRVKTVAISKFNQRYSHLKWNSVKSMLKYIFSDTEIKINVYTSLIKQPKPEEIPEILKEFHSDLVAGHQGVNRTYEKISQCYKWKNMRTNIANFVKKCDSC